MTPSLNSVRFACTSLAGVNKAGVLKKDDQGYYEVVVGALNVFNSAGQFYVFEKAKELFTSSGQLMRRVANGNLRGEYGHPKLIPGMTKEQFIARIFHIYETNVCCHFREVMLDFDRVKDAQGKPVIAIIAWVKPSGPMGAALEKSLENPNENVCFSIRAFTDDYREGMLTKRILRTIVTWDYVNEPGISVAEKFKAPSLEDLVEESLSRGEIERGVRTIEMAGMAQEAAILTADELFTSMGWGRTLSSAKVKPAFAQW